MIREREKQRMQHPTPEAIDLRTIETYTIGSTLIRIVNEPKWYYAPNTYLVERNGIYFHMTGPELEASTGAVAPNSHGKND